MFDLLKNLRGKRATNAAKPPRWLRAHYRAADATKKTAEWWKIAIAPYRMARKFGIILGS